MPFTAPTLSTTDNYPTQFGRLTAIVEGPARRNFIRNGDFQIAQRGTSFAGITAAAYTLDGWQFPGSAGTNTITQQAFTVGQTTVPNNPRFWLRVDRTVAAGAANALIQQPIEMPDRLAGKTITVSFYAKVGSGTKALAVDLLSSGVTTAIDSTDQAFTCTTTWTLFSFQFTVPTMTAVTSSAYLAVRLLESTGLGTFTLDIAEFQVELGQEATYFERLEYTEQETWAQRFFAKSFARATAPAQNVGNGSGEHVFIAGKAAATAECSPRILFPVRMRAAPGTPTLYNPAAANAQVRDQTAAADCSASAAANITDQGFHVTATGNASTAVGNILGVHYAASAEL